MKRYGCCLALLLLLGCGAALPPADIDPPDELAQLEPPVRRQFELRHRTLSTVLGEADAPPARQASALGAVGEIHLAYGYLTTAERAFAAASSLLPDEPRWLYGLAQAQLEEGRAAAAEASLRGVLERLPTHVPSHLALAEAAAQRGDVAAATSHFDTALRLDPASVRAWMGKSSLALERGALDEALQAVLEALMRQPDAAPLHYQAALVYRARREAELAERHLARLPTQNVAQVQLRTDDPWLEEIDRLRIGARRHDRRAQRYLATGRFREAVVELRQSMAANAGRSYARYGIALSLYQLQRRDEALAELDRLLAEAPLHVPSMVLQARILLDDGRRQEARRVLDRARQLDPDDPTVRAIEERLGPP